MSLRVLRWVSISFQVLLGETCGARVRRRNMLLLVIHTGALSVIVGLVTIWRTGGHCQRRANVDKKHVNHVSFQTHNACFRIDNYPEAAEDPEIVREVMHMGPLDSNNQAIIHERQRY